MQPFNLQLFHDVISPPGWFSAMACINFYVILFWTTVFNNIVLVFMSYSNYVCGGHVFFLLVSVR